MPVRVLVTTLTGDRSGLLTALRSRLPATAGALGDSSSSARPIVRLEALIDHRWGLLPLEHLAASVGLGREPAPVSVDSVDFDMDALDEYRNEIEAGRRLEFSEFLHDAYEGIYLPIGTEDLIDLPAGLGSVRKLSIEMRRLREVLDQRDGKRGLGSPAIAREGGFELERLSIVALESACGFSIETGLPISFEVYFDPFPANLPIGYRESSYLGFDEINSAMIVRDGEAIEVGLASGYRYLIPVEYLITWDAENEVGGMRRASDVDLVGRPATSLEVALESGQKLAVGTVAILAGCEPYYEHFGGWTPAAVANVEKWHRVAGPFRISPAFDPPALP